MPQHLKQTARVARGRALLIVVEVNEHRAALSLPLDDMVRPGAQGLVGVVVFVAAVGPVSAQIDMTCSYLPRRGRIMMIGKAQCDVMRAQELVNIVVVPALVAKLEGVGVTAGQQSRKDAKRSRFLEN